MFFTSFITLLIYYTMKPKCLQGHFGEAVNNAGARPRTKGEAQRLASQGFMRVLYHTNLDLSTKTPKILYMIFKQHNFLVLNNKSNIASR